MLTVLNANIGSSPEVIYCDDNGNITYLQGKFYDGYINYDSDALQAAQELAPAFGLGEDDSLEIGSTALVGGIWIYTLDQYCEGIPIYGANIKVITSFNGMPVAIDSNLCHTEYFGAYYAEISLDEALEAAESHTGSELSGGDLVFYQNDDGELVLCLCFDGEYSVFVDAHDGSIVDSVQNILEGTVIPGTKGAEGKNYIPTAYDDEQNVYVLYDQEREILYLNKVLGTYDRIESSDDEWGGLDLVQSMAIASHFTIADVYDFFLRTSDVDRNELGSGNLQVILNYSQTAGGEMNLYFRALTEDYANYEMVAHEFTHVFQFGARNGVSINLDGSDGAIAEGYSDIMGALAEIYFYGQTDWIFGTDTVSENQQRNIANPEDSDNPVQYARVIRVPYTDDYSHYASTLISHPLYLIYQQSGLNDLSFGKLLSTAWSSTSYNESFTDYVVHLANAARQLGYGEELVDCIYDAFEEVNIVVNKKSVLVGEVLSDTGEAIEATARLTDAGGNVVCEDIISSENGVFALVVPKDTEFTIEIFADGYEFDGQENFTSLLINKSGRIYDENGNYWDAPTFIFTSLCDDDDKYDEVFDGDNDEIPADAPTDGVFIYEIDEDECYVLGLAEGCDVTEIVIPDSFEGRPVIEIAEDAFRGNNSITSVKIGGKLKIINSGAFYGCTNLKNVEIYELGDFRIIYDEAFYGCEGLESFTMPYFANRIFDGAFKDCTNLHSFTFPAMNYCYISRDSFENTPLVEYENGAYYVQNYVIGCDDGLENLIIREGTKAIVGSAFEEKTLEYVYIPASVTDMGYKAFYGCDGLDKIDFGGTMDAWNEMSTKTMWYHESKVFEFFADVPQP